MLNFLSFSMHVQVNNVFGSIILAKLAMFLTQIFNVKLLEFVFSLERWNGVSINILALKNCITINIFTDQQIVTPQKSRMVMW